MDQLEAWAWELERAAGREFRLPSEGKARLVNGRGENADVRVRLPAGTLVRLVKSTHDSSLTRVYHQLAVLSGPAAGSLVKVMDAPGAFPWESTAETKPDWGSDSLGTRRSTKSLEWKLTPAGWVA
jgi:hypothetical protein